MNKQESSSYCNVSNIFCDMCLTSFGEMKPADGFCVNCSSSLCKSCCKYHKVLGATKAHILVTEREPQQRAKMDATKRDTPRSEKAEIEEKTGKAHAVPAEKCIVHRSYMNNYYCSVCDHLCCSLCVEKRHKTCKNVQLVEDITSERNVKVIVKTLQDVGSELAKNKIRLISNEQKIKTLTEKTRSRISAQSKEITELLEQIQADFGKKMERLENEGCAKLESASTMHDILNSKVAVLHDKIENAQRGGKYELFEAINNIKKDTPLLQFDLEKLKELNDMEASYLDASIKADQALKQMKELVHVVQGAYIRMQHN